MFGVCLILVTEYSKDNTNTSYGQTNPIHYEISDEAYLLLAEHLCVEVRLWISET